MQPETSWTKKHWRIIELIKWGQNYFAEKGFENPRREIEWLLTDLLSLSRVDLYLNFDQPVNSNHLKILKEWIKRRLKREPLQYITGKMEFYGLPLNVNSHVLIPRPETERLVEIAIEIAEKINAKIIVDVGSGSGCIAIALASRLNDVKILAVDNSQLALDIAQTNADQNNVLRKIDFLKLDILKEDLPGTFDLLVSNPPYVSKDEMSMLMPEVRDYEPINALSDGGDGLKFYRQFLGLSKKNIRSGGFLVLEVGLGSHPKEVFSIFTNSGFNNITLYKDLNGNDRVISVEVPE